MRLTRPLRPRGSLELVAHLPMPPTAPGTAASLWLDESPVTTYPRLDGDLSVDVAVVGGGMVGLTVAALLKRGGATVALVEAERVARGASGRADGVLSALHGRRYAELVARWGEEPARAYADSNRAAVETVARLVAEEGLDCGFERTPDHLYAETPDGARIVEREADAVRLVGLGATLVADADLPFAVRTALRLPGQAQLDPHRYLTGLARGIPGEGSHLLERTRATGVHEGEPCLVHTPHGTIVAGDVIVATLRPIVARGAFFARTYPVRTGSIAVDPGFRAALAGTFTGAEAPARRLRGAGPGGDTVLIGGEAKEGTAGERALEDYARERLGPLSVRQRWSTEDLATKIGVPFAGRVTPLASRLHVATGFGDVGLSGATAAAQVLADSILRRPNLWSWLYDPNRWRPVAGLGSLLAHDLDAARRGATRSLVGRLRR